MSQPLKFRSGSCFSEPKPKAPKPPKPPKPPKEPKAPKAPKAPKPPKESKALMSSLKLQQKAAGYLLAAANARSKE